MKRKIFVDMDGVLADFHARAVKLGMTGDDLSRVEGAYKDLAEIPNAIWGVRALIGLGFEVWIATKTPTGIASAYADKAQWIFDKLPELKRKIVITHDKGILGEPWDFLVDDRPHKANCADFRGTLIVFGDHPVGSKAELNRSEFRTIPLTDWVAVVNFFKKVQK